MQLGAFSVSLAVKDLRKSLEFYEKLGFTGGDCDPAQGWTIVRNGSVTIGLFQQMFEGNILTFNPGWDQNAQPLKEFLDVRDLQKQLQEKGLNFALKANPDGTGPAHAILEDPDGNKIMFDQHV